MAVAGFNQTVPRVTDRGGQGLRSPDRTGQGRQYRQATLIRAGTPRRVTRGTKSSTVRMPLLKDFDGGRSS